MLVGGQIAWWEDVEFLLIVSFFFLKLEARSSAESEEEERVKRCEQRGDMK